jgi:hypothetical protein
MDYSRRSAGVEGVSRRGWTAASPARGAAAAYDDEAPAPLDGESIRRSIAFRRFQSAGENWNLAKTAQAARSLQAEGDCAAVGFPNVIACTSCKRRDADDPASGAIPPRNGRTPASRR